MLAACEAALAAFGAKIVLPTEHARLRNEIHKRNAAVLGFRRFLVSDTDSDGNRRKGRTTA
jgi:hypothetical protein